MDLIDHTSHGPDRGELDTVSHATHQLSPSSPSFSFKFLLLLILLLLHLLLPSYYSSCYVYSSSYPYHQFIFAPTSVSKKDKLGKNDEEQ